MKKFELTSNFKLNDFGRKLFQIRALIQFADVNVGDLGGWIEKEDNLSQDGDAWVSGDALVYGNADYTTIKGFGYVCRNTTFFRCKDGLIRVNCGCFFGTIDEFRKKVVATYGDKKYAKEYLMIADLMEYHFE